MHDKTGKRKVSALWLSAVLLPISVILAYKGGVAARWDYLPLGYAAALALLLVWVVCFAFALGLTPAARSKQPLGVTIFLLGTAFVIAACVVAARLGESGRRWEIQRALDAGLRQDCLALFDNWPNAHDSRIYYDYPEFQQLPASIRMLEPVYVVKDDFYPLNIGICKNGFGGFHMGIRVFQHDERVPGTGPQRRRERIAPNVYLWEDPT
ncbi:MAG: hypothetical protein V2A58_03810 [Planctomycetota bacterium]